MLERLAKNSEIDRSSIAEILAAFVRSQAPWPAGDKNHPDPHPTEMVDDNLPWLRDRAPDVQAAMIVPGRRTHSPDQGVLILTRSDLRRSYLSRGRWFQADFGEANLAACWARFVSWKHCRFFRTDLRNAVLSAAVLDNSDFTEAHLDGATLESASLRAAILTGASLRDVDFHHADLRGSNLNAADPSGARLQEARLDGITFDGATVWPEGFQPT